MTGNASGQQQQNNIAAGQTLASREPPPQPDPLANRLKTSIGVPSLPSLPMPSFSFINNFGSNVGNLPSRALGRVTYLSENAFASAWTSIFGQNRMMPSIPNLWFLIKMKLIQQRADDPIDASDEGADRHSVQYYSQDDIMQMKVKVMIQKVNELTGGLDTPDQIIRKEQQLREATLQSREHLKGTQKEKAVKFVTQRLKRLQKLTKAREDEGDFKKHVCVFSWQQKVFGARELTAYRSAEPHQLQSHLEEKYKLQVDRLNELLQNEEWDNPDLVPYIQDANYIRRLRKNQRDLMLRNAQGDSLRHNSILSRTTSGGGGGGSSLRTTRFQGLSSSDEEPNQTGRANKRQRSQGRDEDGEEDREDDMEPIPQITFKDLLLSPLFSYVNVDAFHSNDVLQPIPCSSRSFPKKYLKTSSSERALQSSQVQTMYIMSAVGQSEALTDGEYKWRGDEYVICIIRVYPDGTFDMKPGLSMMPHDSSLSDIQNKWKRDRLQKNLQEKKSFEKSFLFRARDGSVYAYTIHLFNDQKRDPTVDKMRKEVLDEMYQRSLGMKQNLVGRKFTQYPLQPEQIRYHISGQIVSGLNFDCSQYSVRYFLDIPSSSYNVENKNSLLLSASTQMAIPSVLNGEDEEAFFSFPFEIHALALEENPSPIRMYFEVKSRDYFDRHRVQGYGFLTIPLRAVTEEEYKIPTWKPRESIRNSLKSWFVGGSSELEDIKFTGVPTGFADQFLNKYGVPTDSSGILKVRLNIMTQKKPAQKRTRSKRDPKERG